MSIPDVLAQVFNEHGVQVEMQIVDSQPPYPMIRQHEEDDFDFVRGLANRIGADLWEEEGIAHICQRKAWSDEPSLTLTYGSTLLRLSARADLGEQHTSIRMSGKSVSGEADSVTAALRLNVGRSGPDLLEERFGAAQASIVDAAIRDASEADHLAQTHLDRRAQRFVTASGTTHTNAALHPGVVIDLWQVGSPFDGKYYVVTVRHRYDGEQGLRTEFDLERADLFQGGVAEKRPTLRERITSGLPFDRLRHLHEEADGGEGEGGSTDDTDG
jgi:phage protein D